jgi:hypothetical protein
VDEKLKQQAEAAERQRAREALQPRQPTLADMGEVMEVDAVDQYVGATGEFPQSGDPLGPDVVDDTLLEAVSQPSDAVPEVEPAGERPTRRP